MKQYVSRRRRCWTPLCHRQKQGTHRQTCANFSLGHKNIMTLTQRLLFLSGKQTTRAQVGENRPLARTQKKAPRQNEAQDSRHDSKNSVVRRDWIQIHVSHDTRRRHTASIAETILLFFLAKATSPTAQHFRHQQTQMEGSRISYGRQFDPANRGIVNDQ